jgi:hypothetical protein
MPSSLEKGLKIRKLEGRSTILLAALGMKCGDTD